MKLSVIRIPRFAYLALILSISILASAQAQQSRTWTGQWNNRKFGTSGPLRCVATEAAPGRWEATFSGSFQGDPFEYKAVFQSRANRTGAEVGGEADIRGSRYQWTGTVQGNQLRGRYNSAVGNNGEFVLNEVGGRSDAAGPSNLPPNPAFQPADNRLPKPIITDDEHLLFVGNSFMANEGGLWNYLAKAFEKRSVDLASNEVIHYGKSLQQMMQPEVGKEISSDQYDSVVITSGPVEVMKHYHNRIQSAGSKTIVFMTWEPRHPGHQSSEPQYTSATRQAVREMRQMEKDTGAVIIPAAVVYHDLTLRPPDGVSRKDFLWHPDNIHQNELGTLVNAWTMFAVLADESPEGINFDLPPYLEGQTMKSDPNQRLTRDLRRELQNRVWQVVQAWKSGRTHLESR